MTQRAIAAGLARRLGDHCDPQSFVLQRLPWPPSAWPTARWVPRVPEGAGAPITH
ncbi:MAG: hypothetical protein MZV63_32985 [Marinilabiliales bacterium]|nr:hypothetical protein [Marinilabiliales bacterium]